MPSENEQNIPITQPETGTESLRAISTKSTIFSCDARRITRDIDSYPKSRRYVDLQLDEIFASLVELYAEAFHSHWHNFRRTAESHFGNTAITQTGYEIHTKLAQCYISHWMIDLYNSVREAVSRISPVAFTEHFSEELTRYSFEYDAFLSRLISMIKPTHIVGCFEDVMFIPRFNQTKPTWRGENPLNITDFKTNTTLFRSLIATAKEKKIGWKFNTLGNETVGRPIWLFDWPGTCGPCAFFPRQGNYDNIDVVYTYIIGVACTPKLAPQDLDTWQPYIPVGPNLSPDLSQYKRKTPRKFRGAFEYEDINTDNWKFPIPEEISDAPSGSQTQKKRRTVAARSVEVDSTLPVISIAEPITPDAMDIEREFYMLQFKTYTYYERVIAEYDKETRVNALMCLLHDHASFSV